MFSDYKSVNGFTSWEASAESSCLRQRIYCSSNDSDSDCEDAVEDIKDIITDLDEHKTIIEHYMLTCSCAANFQVNLRKIRDIRDSAVALKGDLVNAAEVSGNNFLEYCQETGDLFEKVDKLEEDVEYLQEDVSELISVCVCPIDHLNVVKELLYHNN